MVASEEEGFVLPRVGEGFEGVAAGDAGFGRGAAAEAGLFCASSEEEGFVRAT
jgi:hypothetical protein